MKSSGWRASIWNWPRINAGKSPKLNVTIRRPAVDRRRQHVPVIRVGKGQCRDEGLVPGDQAVGDVLVHESATSGEASAHDIRAIGQDVSRPLVVDWSVQRAWNSVREGELHEQVAQRCWVQGRRRHRGRLAPRVSSPILGLGSTPRVPRVMLDAGPETPACRRAGLPVAPAGECRLSGSGWILHQELDQVRAGDIQQVGSLLELSVPPGRGSASRHSLGPSRSERITGP